VTIISRIYMQLRAWNNSGGNPCASVLQSISGTAMHWNRQSCFPSKVFQTSVLQWFWSTN